MKRFLLFAVVLMLQSGLRAQNYWQIPLPLLSGDDASLNAPIGENHAFEFRAVYLKELKAEAVYWSLAPVVRAFRLNKKLYGEDYFREINASSLAYGLETGFTFFSRNDCGQGLSLALGSSFAWVHSPFLDPQEAEIVPGFILGTYLEGGFLFASNWQLSLRMQAIFKTRFQGFSRVNSAYSNGRYFNIIYQPTLFSINLSYFISTSL